MAITARCGAPAPSIAARKGAAAIVIRSLGTDYHRNPHTGTQTVAEGVTPIPAARSVPSRRRAAPAHAEARQAGDDAAHPHPAQPRHAPVGQRRRRSAGQRSAGRDRPRRRPSRQLGPRHRRDRQRRRSGDHRRRREEGHGGGPAAADDPGRLVRRRGGRRQRQQRLSRRPQGREDRVRLRIRFRRRPGLADGPRLRRRPTRRSPTASPPPSSPLGISRGTERGDGRRRPRRLGQGGSRRRSTSSRTAPAISTITTRPTTRSTRSIRSSSGRTSRPGRRCSPWSPTRPRKSVGKRPRLNPVLDAELRRPEETAARGDFR